MPDLLNRDDPDIDERYNPANGTTKDTIDGTPINSLQKNLRDSENQAGNDAKDSVSNLSDDISSQEGQSGLNNHQVDLSKTATKLSGNLKKRYGIVGLLAAFGIGGGALISFFGPMSMLINLMQNITGLNDTASTSLQRRLTKVIGVSTKDPNTAELCKASTVKCRFHRISNSTLYKLQKKGITPVFNDTEVGVSKRLGYPNSNPTHYQIDHDGKTINVKAADLQGFLENKNNRAIAAKVYGRTGVINMRMQAWTGKYISRMYSKLGINRLGGTMSEAMKKLESKSKIYEKISGFAAEKGKQIDAAADKIKQKVDGHIGKAKKAGIAYTLAYTGCVSVKAGSYLSAGVAAVQLAQLSSFAPDYILSPGAKLQASSLSPLAKTDSNEVSNASSLLTDRSISESDGKSSSPIDSPYLLSAMGVNKNKPAVPKDYAPGYSMLQMTKDLRSAEAASEPACNAIMSPIAMYSAMAVGIASQLATAGTGAGLIVLAGGWVAQELAIEALKGVFGETAKGFLKGLAENDKISSAKGKDLGTVIGLSAVSMFSSAGMKRGLPSLSKSQIKQFAQISNEEEQKNREMDIASLSPFDTSSQYTFLGSILNNLGTNMLLSGNYKNNFSSVFSNLLSLPTMALSFSSNANASQQFNENYCSYADDFGLSTGDDSTTAAINFAGMPCTGITDAQDSIDPDEALNLMIEEGWIDPNIAVDDTDDLDDLREKKVIRDDTPLATYMETCSDATTGEYIVNSSGCTTQDTVLSNPNINIDTSSTCSSNANGEKVCLNNISGAEDSKLAALKNPKSLTAIPIFLLDYQVNAMFNGLDDGSIDPSNQTSSETPQEVDPSAWAVDANHNGAINKGSAAWGNWVGNLGGNGNSSTGALKPIDVGYEVCSQSNTLNQNGGGNLFNPNAAASAAALIKAFNDANPGKYLTPGACFRSLAGQNIAWDRYQSGGNLAARPGTSNHGWGLAIDFRVSSTPGGLGESITSFSSPYYSWLMSNAYKFGWINPIAMRPSGGCSGSKCEAWHFQYVGAL